MGAALSGDPLARFGCRVGHWTAPDGTTGCTVLIPPTGNVTSCDIRGASPGSRELALLHPDRRLTEVHAVLLTGGSAFGLAAADGVVTWLEEHGIGYSTPVATVPIVPTAVIFDSSAGTPGARPTAASGYAACAAASESPAAGRVGAGAGATVGKWAGFEHAVPGGLGLALAETDRHAVGAIAVVNAVGDVIADDGSVLAGTRSPEARPRPVLPSTELPTSTVLAVLVTSGHLDKRDVRWLAARGSDGITQTIRPAHTRYDGDVVFAVATPPADPAAAGDLDVLGPLATAAVAAAIRHAVG